MSWGQIHAERERGEMGIGKEGGVGARSIPMKPSSVQMLLTAKLLSHGVHFPLLYTSHETVVCRRQATREDTYLVSAGLTPKMGPSFAYSIELCFFSLKQCEPHNFGFGCLNS